VLGDHLRVGCLSANLYGGNGHVLARRRAALLRQPFTAQKLAIEREERHLLARFGKTFVDYVERVRRWI